jgi:hypothetical protein
MIATSFSGLVFSVESLAAIHHHVTAPPEPAVLMYFGCVLIAAPEFLAGPESRTAAETIGVRLAAEVRYCRECRAVTPHLIVSRKDVTAYLCQKCLWRWATQLGATEKSVRGRLSPSQEENPKCRTSVSKRSLRRKSTSTRFAVTPVIPCRCITARATPAVSTAAHHCI